MQTCYDKVRALANERTWSATERAVAPKTTLGTVAGIIIIW